MTRAAAVIFAALVAATFGAFFVTQRIKQSPTVVQGVKRTPYMSPNGDGRHDLGRVSFRLRRSDDVTVAIVDHDGGVVRRLTDARPLPAYRRLSLVWNGRTDSGERAPDGIYRTRVGLRRQGRSVTLPFAIVLDSTPPEPRVLGVKPDIFPQRGVDQITVRFAGPKRKAPEFIVYKDGVAQPVARFFGRAGSPLGVWDGRLADGRRATAGTYLIAVRVQDRAGNFGTGPATLPPRPGAVAGHPGVTVRYVGVTPPLTPVAGGTPATFFVDARGRRYDWTLRRVGNPRILKRGSKTSPRLTVRAPRGNSGVFLLAASSGAHATRVPFAVRAARTRPVLVILPAITWQGRNPVDDDGDGIGNTLDRVLPVRLSRPFAGGGLPVGFATSEGPLLSYLDRAHLRYDLTTDVALATGDGPKLAGHAGVIVPGDMRWLPRPLEGRLRRFVRGGGHLATLGIDSLRRGVDLKGGALSTPTGAAARDIFGARVRPLVRRPIDLLAFPKDELQLFFGTDGHFAGFDAYEQTLDLERGARVLAGAGEREGQQVLLAYRLGKGYVIRFGLPQWAAHLHSDPNVAAVMRRTWTLLSR